MRPAPDEAEAFEIGLAKLTGVIGRTDGNDIARIAWSFRVVLALESIVLPRAAPAAGWAAAAHHRERIRAALR